MAETVWEVSCSNWAEDDVQLFSSAQEAWAQEKNKRQAMQDMKRLFGLAIFLAGAIGREGRNDPYEPSNWWFPNPGSFPQIPYLSHQQVFSSFWFQVTGDRLAEVWVGLGI